MDHGGKFDPEQTVEVHRIRTEHSILYLIRDPSAGFYLSARLTRLYPTPWRSLLPTLFIPGTSRGRTAARTAGERARPRFRLSRDSEAQQLSEANRLMDQPWSGVETESVSTFRA
jgi:hypothetical protein